MSAFQPMTYLISLVILLACLGCHAAVAAPEDLHEHRDPHGFVVRLPQGWTAETLENETILLHSEDRSLFAVIRPFFLTEPSTAEAWVRKAPQTFSDFFPQSHLLKAVQHSRLPDEVLASLTYRAHGKD